jgi:hypothetical protein
MRVEDRQRSNLTAGLILVALGLVFLFGQLDWRFAHNFQLHELWPIFPIVIGITKLMQPADPRAPGRRGSGGWFIFVGVIFLLHNYNVLPIHKSWPLFIVAAGVTLLTHRHADRPADAARSTQGEP